MAGSTHRRCTSELRYELPFLSKNPLELPLLPKKLGQLPLKLLRLVCFPTSHAIVCWLLALQATLALILGNVYNVPAFPSSITFASSVNKSDITFQFHMYWRDHSDPDHTIECSGLSYIQSHTFLSNFNTNMGKLVFQKFYNT